MNAELLSINDLKVSFASRPQGGFRSGKNLPRVQAVRGLNLLVRQGELHSLVGESGSGKTVTSTAVMGLLPFPQARVDSGEIKLQGTNLLELTQDQYRSYRGTKMSMVFQEPSRYLNPAFKMKSQIGEMLKVHRSLDKNGIRERTQEVLLQAGLHDPGRVMESYPHELSGGMKQRAMIALAMCCDPSFLIADEPTTALDVTLQLQILKLILSIRDSRSMGILFISHDLRVVKDISDMVSVIYAGRIVESANKAEFFSRPIHPYSTLLLGSIPDAQKRGKMLTAIQGKVPDPAHIPGGCAFHPRCPRAEEICSQVEPVLKDYGSGHKAACHMLEKS